VCTQCRSHQCVHSAGSVHTLEATVKCTHSGMPFPLPESPAGVCTRPQGPNLGCLVSGRTCFWEIERLYTHSDHRVYTQTTWLTSEIFAISSIFANLAGFVANLACFKVSHALATGLPWQVGTPAVPSYRACRA